jgi:hypothetical protein
MCDSTWVQLQLELKKPSLDPDSDTFDHKLSLSQATKNLIKDPVVNHEKGKERSGLTRKTDLDDLVDDKGRGLVMLFHGPPGVRKTLLIGLA